MSGHDLVTMGRVSVDLYPRESGVPLEEVATFARFLGGSPVNVAVAAARLGRRSAVVTRVGGDPFGRFVRRALAEYGVSGEFVAEVPGLPTPLAFCEIFPPDSFPLHFRREPEAPDMRIEAAELDLAAIAAARIFWATVTGLAGEPSRSATLAALEAHPGPTVLDLDWRPMFWHEDPGPWIAAALGHATIAVGNLEECEVAVGTRDPRAAAEGLLARGAVLAVVKRGPDGVLAATATEAVEVPPVAVAVVNGLGAGDAFGGALCHGLLAGWDLSRTIAFASAAGAIVASRLACSAAMPYADEVEELLCR